MIINIDSDAIKEILGMIAIITIGVLFVRWILE
jgi:hypothetical protein